MIGIIVYVHTVADKKKPDILKQNNDLNSIENVRMHIKKIL